MLQKWSRTTSASPISALIVSIAGARRTVAPCRRSSNSQGHVLARLQRDDGMPDGRMAEPGQPYEHQQRPRRPTRAEGWHEMQKLHHGTGQLALLMTGRKRTGVAGLIPTAIQLFGVSGTALINRKLSSVSRCLRHHGKLRRRCRATVQTSSGNQGRPCRADCKLIAEGKATEPDARRRIISA